MNESGHLETGGRIFCWKNKKDRNYNTIKEIENTIGKKILPSFDMEKLK